MANPSGLTDPKMIEFLETYSLGFQGDSAEFILFDPDFGGTFLADWETAIDASINEPTDEFREDEQMGLTEEVMASMKDCRKAYRLNRYFVVKAFPNDITTQNKFALDNYVANSNSQSGMAILMTELHKMSEHPNYKPALLAAEYKQADIDSLLTLRDALRVDNKTQNQFIRYSTRASQQRYNVHAASWSFAQRVNAASKVMYMDDLVKRNFYNFPASSTSASDFDLTGTVTDSGTSAAIEGAVVKFPTLGLAVTTDENGKYGASGLPTGNVTIEVSMPGYVLQNLNATIPATGTATLDVALVANP